MLWEASPEPIQPTHPYPVPDLPLTPAQPPAGPHPHLERRQAIEKQIPDVRERAKVTLVGTPLTHERFLRREGGSYGPFLAADGSPDGMLAMQGTCLPGLLCCGDSTFPGIGMPAVVSYGYGQQNVSAAQDTRVLCAAFVPPLCRGTEARITMAEETALCGACTTARI